MLRKILTISTILLFILLILSAAFLAAEFSMFKLKFFFTMLALTLIFIALTMNQFLINKHNRWFGYLGIGMVIVSALTVCVSFYVNSFFLYENWVLVGVLFASGLICLMLVSIGFLGKFEVKSKVFQQILAFLLILIGLTVNFMLLQQLAFNELNLALLITVLSLVLICGVHNLINISYKKLP